MQMNNKGQQQANNKDNKNNIKQQQHLRTR